MRERASVRVPQERGAFEGPSGGQPIHSGKRRMWGVAAYVLALTLGSACATPPVKPDPSPAAVPSTAPSGAPSSTSPADGAGAAAAAPATTDAGAVASVPETPKEESKPTAVEPAPAPAATPEPPSSDVFPSEPAGSKEEAFKQGVEAMERGVSGYDVAISRFNSVLSSDSRNIEALFNKGIVYTRKGDLREAEKIFKKVIDLNPKFNGGWANLADVYRREKDTAKALETLEEGLKVLPGNALLLNGKAFIYRQTGRSAEAIEEIRKILKVNATDVNAFNNMGRAYLEMKDYDMALVIFLKALQTAPGAEKDAWIHNNLGLTYLGLKDPRAAGEFGRALELQPTLLESLVCRAFLHLELQEYEKAADLLRTAAGLSPKDPIIKLNLGVALRGLKEYDRAELQYQEALKIEPKNAQVLLNYGILMGDYVKNYLRAVELYTQLKEVTPAGPEQERVEKMIAQAKKAHEREQKKLKDKAAKPEPPPAPAETPAPEPAKPETPAPPPEK